MQISNIDSVRNNNFNNFKALKISGLSKYQEISIEGFMPELKQLAKDYDITISQENPYNVPYLYEKICKLLKITIAPLKQLKNREDSYIKTAYIKGWSVRTSSYCPETITPIKSVIRDMLFNDENSKILYSNECFYTKTPISNTK